MRSRADKKWNNFLNTLSFMSRIPVKVAYPAEIELVFFPIIGLIISLLVYFSSFIFSAFFEAEISALLVLVFYIYLTGALHLDGLGDFADAYFADRDKEKTIKIMHDSNSGVYAVVTLVLFLILKYLLFKNLLINSNLEALLLMAVLARFFAAAGLSFFETSAASRWAESVNDRMKSGKRISLSIVTLIILFLLIIVFGLEYAGILLISFGLGSLLVYYLGEWSKNKIGGISGDICGTIIELSEIIFLITTAAILK